MPDRELELELKLLDAMAALRRIRDALGLERTIPMCSSGFDEIATEVEELVARIDESRIAPALEDFVD